MHEAHAPHEPIHSWRQFFVHIATIVIGLLLAVGLEQTVEFFHHRHQRVELEAQMREVLEIDLRVIDENQSKLRDYHTYLTELRLAAQARREGRPTPQPAFQDPRSSMFLSTPSLAPYE